MSVDCSRSTFSHSSLIQPVATSFTQHSHITHHPTLSSNSSHFPFTWVDDLLLYDTLYPFYTPRHTLDYVYDAFPFSAHTHILQTHPFFHHTHTASPHSFSPQSFLQIGTSFLSHFITSLVSSSNTASSAIWHGTKPTHQHHCISSNHFHTHSHPAHWQPWWQQHFAPIQLIPIQSAAQIAS